MPRVRRLRREAPALELLAATLPELRLGLSEPAARTVAYEVFEKLGYGAVAVTDTTRVLAFTGAGADHHGPGDEPIRPVFEPVALTTFYSMAVPRDYVRCLADVAVPPERAAAYAARLGVRPVEPGAEEPGA